MDASEWGRLTGQLCCWLVPAYLVYRSIRWVFKKPGWWQR